LIYAIRVPSSHFIRRLRFYIRIRFSKLAWPPLYRQSISSIGALKPRARDPNLSGSSWTQIKPLFIRIAVLSNEREYRRAMENTQRDLTLMANCCPQTTNFPAIVTTFRWIFILAISHETPSYRYIILYHLGPLLT